MTEENPWTSIEEQALIDRVKETETISVAKITEAATLMTIESRSLEEGDYKVLDIGNMFLDCIDRVQQDISSTAQGSRTAMVAARERWALPALHQDKCNMTLRVVDPLEDEGIWAVIDEGCNSNTHSEIWRKNLQMKCEKMGFQPVQINAKVTQFTGVGTARTTGKWRFPIGMKLEESGLIIPGSISSHEMAAGSHPLLLSQAAQGTLGFRKDVRDGSVMLRDYENQHLEVVRASRTGLFMVRIDHLVASMYQDPKNICLMITLPKTPESSCGVCDDQRWPDVGDEHAELDSEDDFEDMKPFAYPVSKAVQEGEFKPSLLKANTIVVSCGLLNFEGSSYSSRMSQDWLNNHPVDHNGRPSRVMPGLLTPGHVNYDKGSHERFCHSFEQNVSRTTRS